MARSYDMTGRRRAQAETRSRAVSAACALLSAPECGELTIESVAKASNVTRVTLHNHFGTRAELLLAVFRELGQRMQAERIRDAMRAPDPELALQRTFIESTRAWQRERLAVARVFALSVFDPEMAREVGRAERARRASLAFLARRLTGAGVLGSGISAGEASKTLGALTSFQVFDAFAGGSPVRSAGRLLELARRSLGLAESKRANRKGKRR